MRTTLNPNVRILGTGSYLPPGVVDNKSLGEIVKGYDAERSGDFGAWVDQMTHIHERRFGQPQTRSSDLAEVAARRAMKSAGIEPGDIDMLMYATFTPSEMIPGDHCNLADRLGLQASGVVQLMAACAGSIYGMGMAWGMLASGAMRNILVVGTETASKALNFHDPVTAILFGDGAGAVVMSRDDSASEGGVLPPLLDFHFSPRNIHLANSNVPVDVGCFPDRAVQPGVHLVEQALVEMEGGPAVLRKAIKRMAGCVARCLGYEEKDLKRGNDALKATLADACIIPHQANGRILDGMAKDLGVPPERVIRTIYRYGNISAASNLVALDFALRRGNMSRVLDDNGHVLSIAEHEDQRIRSGDLVLLPSIGGGYLMGCMGFVADAALTQQGAYHDAWSGEAATALA